MRKYIYKIFNTMIFILIITSTIQVFSSEVFDISKIKKDPNLIQQIAKDINSYEDALNFQLDLIDPVFILNKIKQSHIFNDLIKIERYKETKLQPHQKYTLFSLYENNILTYIVKTQPFKNLQYQSNFEALCYEIAHTSKIESILPEIKKVSDGIIVSFYLHDGTGKPLHSVGDLQYNQAYNFLQLDFEKALVFSFLTAQQDMNQSNVLLKKSKHEQDCFSLYLIDLAYSMSETELNERVGVFLPCLLFPEKIFENNLQQVPSEEIKHLVRNINEESFFDIFKTYALKKEEQQNFYKRLEDLKDAFETFKNDTLFDIFINLFQAQDLFSKKIYTKKTIKKLDIPKTGKKYKTLSKINKAKNVSQQKTNLLVENHTNIEDNITNVGYIPKKQRNNQAYYIGVTAVLLTIIGLLYSLIKKNKNAKSL